MRNSALLVLLLGLVFAACSAPGPTPQRQAQLVQASQAATACSTVGPSSAGIIVECIVGYLTNTPTATATDTPTATATATATPTAAATATATAVAITATPIVSNVVQLVPWHPPGAHLDPVTHRPLTPHEHGDAPPAWVLAGAHQPFTQYRESHVGYKGAYAPNDKGSKGVESYLITHVLSTVAARLHGDHDFQLWIRTPGTGTVSYFSGLLDFGTPPIFRLTDTGERPIILAKGDEGATTTDCETWYARPGSNIFDLGWTICNRYSKFNGTVLGGNGIYRGMDWTIYTDRFSEFAGADPALVNYCSDDGFGHCRFQWLVIGHEYPGIDVVVPIN
jgi:hypothetical protein